MSSRYETQKRKKSASMNAATRRRQLHERHDAKVAAREAKRVKPTQEPPEDLPKP
jgi:hypothetical protein